MDFIEMKKIKRYFMERKKVLKYKLLFLAPHELVYDVYLV